MGIGRGEGVRARGPERRNCPCKPWYLGNNGEGGSVLLVTGMPFLREGHRRRGCSRGVGHV